MGMDDVPEAESDLVMHGQLETPAGFTLMAVGRAGAHGLGARKQLVLGLTER